MKMRKLLAILLSSAMLMAMAILPANAATTTADFAEKYLMSDEAIQALISNTNNGDGWRGDVGGTVTFADGLAQIPTSGRLLRLESTNYIAAEVKLTVNRGATTVLYTANFAGASLNVVINADGTYAIKRNAAENVVNGSGTYTAGSAVTVRMAVDAVNSLAVVTVSYMDGEDLVEKVTPIDLSTFDATIATRVKTGLTELHVIADATEGDTAPHTTVEYIEITNMNNKETATGNVTVTVNPVVVTETVYAVDIEFGDFTFVYTPASQGEWNADELKYENASAGGWDKTGDTVTITNRSNASVWVQATYAPVTEGDTLFSLSGDAATAAVELASAAINNEATATTVTGTVNGTPAFTGTQKIGTITVTISATNPNA